MWMWRSFLCVSLVCGLALDHNTIRSSKETTQQNTEQQDRVHGDQVERPVRRRTETMNSNRRQRTQCSTEDCYTDQVGGCSNRAQRRPSSQDRPVDRPVDGPVDGPVDRPVDGPVDGPVDRPVDGPVDGPVDREINTDGFNRTKAPEMASCVRSGDCAAGLCCVRYLTGKRCQRIPVEGEACLLRGSGKMRRKLGRCDCDVGLTCTASSTGRAESGRTKGQGACQRNARHSGKKRRTAERSC